MSWWVIASVDDVGKLINSTKLLTLFIITDNAVEVDSVQSQIRDSLSIHTANVNIAEPYKFIPPRKGTFVSSCLKIILPWYLRRSWGVLGHEIRGAEKLSASLESGHGVVLAPNHVRECDAITVGFLAVAFRCHLHFMARWHVF